MTTLDGSSSVTLDSFRGRPILLTFWATWCGPCRVELPELRDLYGELVGEGFVLLTVNVDNSPLIADRFLAQLGVKVPVYRMSRGDIAALQINALPTNILLDRDGRVAMATAGYDPRMPAEIRRLVEGMNGDSPDESEHAGR
jgi:thiol-disulfide isomerase/thioredoxin